LEASKRGKQVESVRSWWNLSRNDNKWDRDYEAFPEHGSRYLISRKNIVLKYLDELQLVKGSNILELGYGAGQVALEIGERGFNTYGLDISEKFSISATARCINEYPDGFFDLRVGSIESKYDFDDGYFDAVIVVGALQYLFSPNDCFKEVFRVLKPNGHFIIAQRNIYSLSNFTSVRYFIRSCMHFILKGKYEIFPSFKSMLTESRLGYLFSRYKDSRIINTKFMLKGQNVLKFEINKRANSYFSLKSRLKKNGFKCLNADGAYFAFSEDPKYYDFNKTSDKALKIIAEKHIIPFIFTLGRSVVLKAKKTT
jgi:SAM-dependent methyltransferase